MIRFALRSPFGRGVSWNLASLGVLAVCGVVLNTLMARFYGAAALGVFNQVFAIYILVSQVLVFGLQFSVLKHVSELADDAPQRNACVTSALALCLGLSTLGVAAAYAASPLLRWIFVSPEVERGFLYTLPGLWFFSCNKVLLALVNARLHMRMFAVAQSARYLLLLAVLAACYALSLPGGVLPGILSVTEAALLLFLAPYGLRLFSASPPRNWGDWPRRHLAFGARAFPSGILGELNTRVDVLILGMFASASQVGLYSMCATIVEGMGQLAAVLRNNLNPLLAQAMAEGRREDLRRSFRLTLRVFYPAMAALALVAALAYPTYLRLAVADREFAASAPILWVLLAGLTVASGLLPFNMILLLCGRPGLYTVYNLLVTGTRAALNLALAPFYGVMGAAVATACALAASAGYLLAFMRTSVPLLAPDPVRADTDRP